jgi:hypothetical protein
MKNLGGHKSYFFEDAMVMKSQDEIIFVTPAFESHQTR